MSQPYEVEESSTYLSAASDTTVIVGTNTNGEDLLSFVFLNNAPVVMVNENDQVIMQSIKKQKIATISMSISQAKNVYDSLTKLFEEDLPAMMATKKSKDEGKP